MTPGAAIDLAGSGRLETELLLCCARTHVDVQTTARIRELIRLGIDWKLLIRTAAPQGVTALLLAAQRAIRLAIAESPDCANAQRCAKLRQLGVKKSGIARQRLLSYGTPCLALRASHSVPRTPTREGGII